MSTEAWVEFNGVEIVNLSRTVQLARSMGIDTVRIREAYVKWVETELGGVDYDDVTTAPWYDANYDPSAEFAGIIPLNITGMDESTLSRSVTEYITDGGSVNGTRNTTRPLVWSALIVASSPRGAEYGRRWLNKVMRQQPQGRCSGSDMAFFRFPYSNRRWGGGVGGWDVIGWDLEGWDTPLSEGLPKAHYRDVALTRGLSITRKRERECSSIWAVTFTMTASDPFEYSKPAFMFDGLGGVDFPGSEDSPAVIDSGTESLNQVSCPVYDYTPIFDPLVPALVTPPTAVNFFPDNWGIADGDPFSRWWAEIDVPAPDLLDLVPLIEVSSSTEARWVRVQVWPASTTTPTDQCGALFSAIIGYLPANLTFYIDGEQRAAYTWDGVSPQVRRADTVVFGPEAEPVDWTAFTDENGLRVTLDVFAGSGEGNVRAAFSTISRGD